MRYATATIGAIFIFIGVLLITGIIVAFLPPMFRPWVNLGLVQTNNPLGLILSALAAQHSFRSTLKHYKAKDAAKLQANPAETLAPHSPTTGTADQ